MTTTVHLSVTTTRQEWKQLSHELRARPVGGHYSSEGDHYRLHHFPAMGREMGYTISVVNSLRQGKGCPPPYRGWYLKMKSLGDFDSAQEIARQAREDLEYRRELRAYFAEWAGQEEEGL